MQPKIRVIGASGRKPIPYEPQEGISPISSALCCPSAFVHMGAHLAGGCTMGTHASQHLLGDKDPVQAVKMSQGHGEQQKFAPAMVRGAGIVLPPWAGTAALGPP